MSRGEFDVVGVFVCVNLRISLVTYSSLFLFVSVLCLLWLLFVMIVRTVMCFVASLMSCVVVPLM